MKTVFYVALGKYEMDEFCYGTTRYIVNVNERELALEPEEYVLWSLLSRQIMNDAELRLSAGYKMYAEHINIDFDISQTLRRLAGRGLIASGTGETDIDALTDLMNCLYVIPIRSSLPFRIVCGAFLLFKLKLPFRSIIGMVFLSLTPEQKKIYRLAATKKMRVSELMKNDKLSILNDIHRLYVKNKIMFAKE